jgi:hypothetical protein
MCGDEFLPVGPIKVHNVAGNGKLHFTNGFREMNSVHKSKDCVWSHRYCSAYIGTDVKTKTLSLAVGRVAKLQAPKQGNVFNWTRLNDSCSQILKATHQHRVANWPVWTDSRPRSTSSRSLTRGSGLSEWKTDNCRPTDSTEHTRRSNGSLTCLMSAIGCQVGKQTVIQAPQF